MAFYWLKIVTMGDGWQTHDDIDQGISSLLQAFLVLKDDNILPFQIYRVPPCSSWRMSCLQCEVISQSPFLSLWISCNARSTSSNPHSFIHSCWCHLDHLETVLQTLQEETLNALFGCWKLGWYQVSCVADMFMNNVVKLN